MAQVKELIGLMLLIAYVFLLEGSVSCSPYVERLENVNRMQNELRRELTLDMKSIFYEKAIANSKFYPLRYLSALMAKCEVMLYAARQKGLLVAGDIIERYFIADKSLPDEILVKHEYLVDAIVQRSIERSIEAGLYSIENYRKTIYLAVKQHESQPGFLNLAHYFFNRIMKTEVKETKAHRDFGKALENYKALEQVMEEDDSKILLFVDQLIYTDKTSFGFKPDNKAEDDELVVKYVDSKLRKDIWFAELKMRSHVERFSRSQIESVQLNDVLIYDDQVVQAYEAILKFNTESTLADWNNRFMEAMQKMFYGPKANEEDAQLLAVVANVGRFLAVAFAEERKMVIILLNLIGSRTEDFARIYLSDKNLIDIIKMRLNKYLFENGQLHRFDFNQKNLHVILSSYNYIGKVKTLASEHAKLVRKKRADAGELSKQLALRERQVPTTIMVRVSYLVDDIVQAAIALWEKGLNELHLLENYIDPKIYDDLQNLKRNTYNKIYRQPVGLIQSVSEQDLKNFEEMLLGPEGKAEEARAEGQTEEAGPSFRM